MVSTVLFYAHTVLCAAFGLYSVGRMAAAEPAGEASLLDWRDLESSDEWVVQGAGYVVISLYLLFTEVYLYRMYLGV